MPRRRNKQKKPGKKAKLILGASVFILLGLLVGYLTFSVLSFTRMVEVPDLHKKNLIEANKLLTKQGLYLKIAGEKYDSIIPPGDIIDQDIIHGQKVKERSAIKVIISKGPKTTSMPLLMNKTLQQAEQILLDKSLKIAQVLPVHSDTIEKGVIIAQNPESDEQISDLITVVVSLGPYIHYYYCPDFRGMSFVQAHNIIKQLGLTMAVEGAGGVVKTQKPQPGNEIKVGDLIYLKLY